MGDRPAKLNEKKSDRELERKISSYSLEEQHEIFLAAKMRNPSGHQGENERVKKSEQQQVRHFLRKTCNWEVFGSFTLWSFKATAKQPRPQGSFLWLWSWGKAREKRPGDEVDGKEMYQKSVLHVQGCFFAN